MDLKYVGENIRRRRKELGLTIVDIHNATGISNGNLSGIETGKSAPSAQAIIALSKVLKCSTDYLLLDNFIQERTNLDHSLSDKETTLLERFNSLDAEGQEDLLNYAQYKTFQNFKNSCHSLPDKKEGNKTKGKYTPLDPENSDNIIA